MCNIHSSAIMFSNGSAGETLIKSNLDILIIWSGHLLLKVVLILLLLVTFTNIFKFQESRYIIMIYVLTIQFLYPRWWYCWGGCSSYGRINHWWNPCSTVEEYVKFWFSIFFSMFFLFYHIILSIILITSGLYAWFPLCSTHIFCEHIINIYFLCINVNRAWWSC